MLSLRSCEKPASLPLPTMDEVKADRARRSLAEFTRQAWPIIEPGTALLWNWHLDAICEHLEAVTAGQIRRLIINIPPGHMKSIAVSVMWPAWEWIAAPRTRSLFSSYAFELAVRDSVRCREIMATDWYQSSFAPTWALRDNQWDFSDDQNTKHWFQNTQKGFRFALSVGGRATGFRGNKVVTDDPMNARDRHSRTKREGVIDWWDTTMSSRLNDPRAGALIMVMQRLHVGDLTGHSLNKSGYVHLCLPSEYDPKRRCVTVIGWEDPRQKAGDLLHPALFTRAVLDQARIDLGSLDYAGQHQQQPAPDEGSILKRKWWKFYLVAPETFDLVIQSWDMAFKDTQASAYVVGQVWGMAGSNIYLLAQRRDKLDFTASCAAVTRLSTEWPLAYTKLIEDKANGPAIINALRSKLSGIVAVQPDGSKEARAYACQPFLEAGNVWLPAIALGDKKGDEPLLDPWVQEFLDEASLFPASEYADQVDAFTQGCSRLLISPLRGESAEGIY